MSNNVAAYKGSLKACIIRFQFPIITSFVIGFLAHTFIFTNKLVNWDEITYLFEKGTTLTSGRWGLELCKAIFPNYSMPWIYGIISLILLTISSCLIIDLIKIKSVVFQCILSGLIVSFPAVVSIFAYMFTSTSYFLAFLLAILAVWLIDKSEQATTTRNKALCVILSLFCVVFAIGIYQAFFSVFTCLLLLKFANNILYMKFTPPHMQLRLE